MREMRQFSKVALLVSLVYVQSCSWISKENETASPQPEREIAKQIKSKKVTSYVDWGEDEFVVSGLGVHERIYESVNMGEEAWKDFCFENNNPCRRASEEVNQIIKGRPTPIHAFQLKLKSQLDKYKLIDVKGAWIKSAVLAFDRKTGEPHFTKPKTHQLGECSLEDQPEKVNRYTRSNAIGFDHSEKGRERLLTGIYLVDDVDFVFTDKKRTKGFFSKGHLHGGKVWYSGLVGVPDNAGDLRFVWVPVGGAAPEAEFGKRSLASTSGVLTKIFGRDYSDWQNRVITGFCMEGTKTLHSDDILPLFQWGKFRTYRPKLKILD